MAFRSGRDFAAWNGLVPRQDLTGGKQKLGPIWQQGDRYVRRILVVGAHAVLRYAKQNPEKYPWPTAGATTLQGRSGSACQQDGAHSLGLPGQGRHLLSGAGACHCGYGSGLMRSRAMGG